jgi:hypothetical protein
MRPGSQWIQGFLQDGKQQGADKRPEGQPHTAHNADEDGIQGIDN